MVSEANTSEYWRTKSNRHIEQKKNTKLFFNPYKHLVLLPVSITICRISPRTLDFDNLVYSLKWVRDALAESLIEGLAPGRADEDDRITWVYTQEKGNPKEYAVRIELLSDK